MLGVGLKSTSCFKTFLIIGNNTGEHEVDSLDTKSGQPKSDPDDAFVQELMDKLELITGEKSEIAHELLQAKAMQEESNLMVRIYEHCFSFII